MSYAGTYRKRVRDNRWRAEPVAAAGLQGSGIRSTRYGTPVLRPQWWMVGGGVRGAMAEKFVFPVAVAEIDCPTKNLPLRAACNAPIINCGGRLGRYSLPHGRFVPFAYDPRLWRRLVSLESILSCVRTGRKMISGPVAIDQTTGCVTSFEWYAERQLSRQTVITQAARFRV